MSYSADLYIHDLDRKAYAAINMFPKLIKLKEAYLANFDEKVAKIELMSTSIRLSENQMPEIYRLLPPICEKLGIEEPELFYQDNACLNAYTRGSTSTYICLFSGLVKELSLEQLSGVIAHECGHIACKHILYHQIVTHLIRGVEASPISEIPVLGKYLTPALFNSLMFWERCSELSADRAAILCEGNADSYIDTLLQIHGYKNINREEFIKQAVDLRKFIDESESNKAIEQLLLQGDNHPALATRVYECSVWSHSDHFTNIVNGTYSIEKNEDRIEEEIITADVLVEISGEKPAEINLDDELERVNKELDRYTSHADKKDYAFAIASGILAGAIDALFVGEMRFTEKEIGLSHNQVNNFIQKYAKARGFEKSRLKDAISALENEFKVAQDNVWKGAGIGVSARNHHLADLAHHPTPLGLAAAIIVQFLRIGTFVNKDGEWHFILVDTTPKDIIQILAPAVMTGILNWIVAIAEEMYEEDSEEEVPEAIHTIAHIAASTPIIVEIAKCADNWFGHLVSDMGGSNNTAGGGMGIPGIFVSLLHEVSSLPVLKDSGLPAFVNDLYVNKKMDLRHEMVIYKSLGRQAVPVIFNEILVRMGYFILHICYEIKNREVKGINWDNVIPFGNRTVERMITVSSMTLNIADTADAAVHAALCSAGNGVLFAGNFVARFNYVGAGRAALAIVNEISSERKEAQLIHEKMILMNIKTAIIIKQIEEYKEKLNEKISNYLAEDIDAFIRGFDFIGKGIETGDSDLTIKGNVIIQKVLGRKPQFTNQEEFDDLMASDLAFQL